jgi:2-aminoadipate transaminase
MSTVIDDELDLLSTFSGTGALASRPTTSVAAPPPDLD